MKILVIFYYILYGIFAYRCTYKQCNKKVHSSNNIRCINIEKQLRNNNHQNKDKYYTKNLNRKNKSK
jgi:hypothetical protein